MTIAVDQTDPWCNLAGASVATSRIRLVHSLWQSLGLGDREFMAKKLTSSTFLLWVKLVYFNSFIKAFPLQ